MTKWYEAPSSDNGVIISSRIRLARNLGDYPFYAVLDTKPELLAKMTDEVCGAISSERTPIGKDFKKIAVDNDDFLSIHLLEKHCISPEFIGKRTEKFVLINTNESVSVMINEEDHIRLQTIFPGDNQDEAFFLADKIDDLIEESLEYAFSESYGYLTSCPTNAGTGMRASYMMHIPALELTGRVGNVLQAVSKLGMTVRGIYGEGSESLGSIYQISNQTTLGVTEKDIIAALKGVTAKLIEQENSARELLLKDSAGRLVDRIYKSYGVLKYARRLTIKEAMGCLSDIRLGKISGEIDLPEPKKAIYGIMTEIQAGGLQERAGRPLDDDEKDYARAEYIREYI